MLRAGIAALVLALAGLGGCSEATGPEREIVASQLYNQYCARCHGADGKPTAAAPTASSFAVAANVERLTDEGIKGVIRAGRGQMPGFGERFTDATLQVLVAYVRKLPAAKPETKASGASAPAP
ncbi:MAG: cytochrome c [Deltaproteobacteria bacterium]|nr:cytochrome c [Deltaproteobacteria bacterium]